MSSYPNGSHKQLPPSFVQPTLIFAHEAWQKLMLYVLGCNKEINGFAYITPTGKDTFWVQSPDDVFITEQVVSMGSADVLGATYAIACQEAADIGRGPALRLQWHSHVNGNAYFSSTDTHNIDAFGDAGQKWMLSLVTNKRGETSVRMDVFNPIRITSPVTLQVVPVYSEAMRDIVDADIQRLVRYKPEPVKKPAYTAWGSSARQQVIAAIEESEAANSDDDSDPETGVDELGIHYVDVIS